MDDLGTTTAALDLAHWQRLSPLLDELLDLDADARATRLASLRRSDPDLAGELAVLLAQEEVLATRGGLHSGPGGADRPPSASTAGPEAPGQTVGPYTLQRELGRGGMGSVWLARRSDGRYEGEVAIKFLRSGLFGHGDAGRFAREGNILARLAHPHIARLIDAGVAPGTGQPYLVLEHVDGEPIDRWCAQHASDITTRVRLLIDVLDAVAHAHTRLILHRDLKPSNILVTRDGQAKLLDFGIAKLLDDATRPALATELTQRAGAAYTPQYAAPEQLQGGEVTTATDVYAFGVLMYGLLGGGHPTTPPDAPPLALLKTVLEVEPARLSDAVRRRQSGTTGARHARLLRGDGDTIVAKALKKAPAERYANAAEMADDLRRWLRHEPIAARPDSNAYRVAKFARRHRGGVAAALLVLLSLTGGLGTALWQGREARLQRAQAEGLVEFMLGDLRDKLEPVGRLDVMDAVSQRVLAHYTAQASRWGAGRDDETQGRHARAVTQIASIAETRGRHDEATRLYRESLDRTSTLLAHAPNDPARLAAQIENLRGLGDVARARSDRTEQARLIGERLQLAARWVGLRPGDADAQEALARAHEAQGRLLMDGNRLDEALAALDTALAMQRRLAAAEPRRHFDSAEVLIVLARVQELRHQRDAAVAAREAAIQALQQVPDAAQDKGVEAGIVSSRQEIGRLRMAEGRLDEAEAAMRQSLAGARALVASDRANLDWLRLQTTIHGTLATLYLERSDWPAAQAELDAAQPLLATLLAAPGQQNFWRIVSRGRQLELQARLAVQRADAGPGGRGMLTGQAPLAAQLQAYLDEVQRLQARGATLDPLETRSVAQAEIALGDLRQAERQAGAQAEALGHWRLAAARLQPLATQRDLGATLALAQAQWRLGERAEAQRLADAATAISPVGLGLTQLRRLLATTTASR